MIKNVKNKTSKIHLLELLSTLINFARGFLLILLFLILGKLISAYLPIAFPGSIIGLVLLFLALITSLVKVEWILLSGNFILKYMALLFIPIGAGLLNYFELIVNNWLVILFSLLFTTLFILFLIGHFYQFMNKEKDM